MNKCPKILKRFHALKKELRIFLLTIFQVPGMDLPEAREMHWSVGGAEKIPHRR